MKRDNQKIKILEQHSTIEDFMKLDTKQQVKE
jgi:hypothetical protein